LRHVSPVLIIGLVPLLFVGAWEMPGRSQSHAKTQLTPVLLELFTSEGCSSCPPADEFLARLNREQPIPGVEVIGIEEHVDYWNHQGWVDPYSSAQWTSRQVQYVDRLKENSPYTPQLVIDGERSVVGGRQQEIMRAVQEYSRRERAGVDVKLEKSSADGLLKLDVRVDKMDFTANDTTEVWLAVAERDVASNVNAGENAGRELRHAAVLRSLKKLGVASAKGEIAFDGSTEVKLSREWKTDKIEAIVFVQERKSRRVVGVAVARPAAG
jgi:hypothetical protein